MEEISIKEFLKQLSEEIETGLDGRAVKGAIKVELSVAKKIDAGGRVKFYILKGGGDYQKEDITKVSFEYYPKREKFTPQARPPRRRPYI